jgi:hypothetical protein
VSSTSLATLPQISQALAQIATVPEAKGLRDKAAALCRYAKESKQSLEIQNRAAYVKLLCERKAGELLLEIPRAPTNQRGQGRNGGANKSSATLAVVLEQAGIPESTARRWQYLAQWPTSELVALMEACNEDEDELTTIVAVSAARSYMEWVASKDKEAEEAEAEESEPQEQTEGEPDESKQTEHGSYEPNEQDEATETLEPPPALAVEKERADRLRQLFDAACDLCRDRPQLVGWITTMHKWQAKLDDLTREK